MQETSIECSNCKQPIDLKYMVGRAKIKPNPAVCHLCHRPYSLQHKVEHLNYHGGQQRLPEVTTEMVESIKPKKEIIYCGETKQCIKCHETQPIEDFYSYTFKSGRKAGKFQRLNVCNECMVKWRASYYERNKEKIKQRQSALSDEQKLAIRKRANERRRKRKLEHPEYYRLKMRQKNQRVRVFRRLRNRVSEMVNGQRGISSSKLLGCSSHELRKHLELKFLPGMSWENYGHGYGNWVVDHIRPMSLSKDLSKDELSKSCHYSNLQPLWYHMNEAKSDNYDQDHPMGWHGLNNLLSEQDKEHLSSTLGYIFN